MTLARKDRVRLRGTEGNGLPEAGAEGKLFVAGEGRGLCDNQLPRIDITCLALCLTPALPYHLIPSSTTVPGERNIIISILCTGKLRLREGK